MSTNFAHGPSSVRAFATEFGLVSVIDRAITFHPAALGNGRLYAVQVEWNHRLERSAGRFNSLRGIELHPGLAHAKAKDLHETFLHELAHAMQFLVYGKVDHLASWWEMMHQLGQKPTRTHNIPECQGRLTPASVGINAKDLGL
jgi:SprT-like family